jgi:hypothetical protein
MSLKLEMDKHQTYSQIEDCDLTALLKNGARRVLSVVVFLILPLASTACPGETRTAGSSQTSNSANTAAAPVTATTPAPTSAALKVDGNRAYKLVQKQVDFGPRPAGSVELAKTRDFIISELKSDGLNVTTDEFTPSTPVGPRKMVNVTAELPGESPDVIIIASHYDTKPFKDFRFVGANDGGSSTALLMEIARAMATSGKKPKFTYRFVFFDGEEAFCEEWDQCSKPGNPDNTYGSRRYVSQLVDKKELKRVRALILLDMIGFKDLEMGKDDMSSRWLVNAIWDTARDLGYSAQFQERPEGVGGDDHEPFLKAGIESVDLIQLGSYPYWHKPGDTLDKVSPQSLQIVGDVVLASLPRIEQHLSEK